MNVEHGIIAVLGTVISMLTAAIIAAQKGKWVGRSIYQKEVDEKRRFMDITAKAVDHAEKVTRGWLPPKRSRG